MSALFCQYNPVVPDGV